MRRRILTPAPAQPVDVEPVPTFSVVIPVYQAAETIGDAVESVLAQTHPPHEIVICDDGSTDDLESALRAYRLQVSVIRQENQGEGAAKNAAALAATGDFVVLLDADDAFLPERLEALGELAAARPDLDILTTDALLETHGRVVRRAYTDRWRFEVEDQRRGILERNFVFGAAAVRRSALEAVGGFDSQLRHAADWDLWIRMIHAGSRAGLVGEPLYRYRIGASALSADRLALTRGFLTVLEKAAALDLSEAERGVLQTSFERHRCELRRLELRQALREMPRDVRRAAVALARDRGQPLSRRTRAAAAALAPSVAVRLERRRRRRGWIGAGGTIVRPPVQLLAYTDGQELGGAEISLGHVLAELPPGYDVTVVGVNAEVVAAVAGRRPGAAKCVLPEVRRKEELGRIVQHVRAFRRIGPDLVHVSLNTPWSAQYGILAGWFVPSAKTVLVEQALFPTTSRARRAFKRIAARTVAAHVAVGERSAREIERMCGLSSGSIRVVYNGVPDVPVASRPRLVDGPTVGSIGRLDRQKGFDVLVSALAALPDVSAVLVGDGPERAALEELAARLGVQERLVITGWQEDARSFLRTFDVFVLPSRRESFPLSVVEAMLAERAVVATDVGSVREAVVDGETGLLVRPDDPVALDQAVLRLLDDEELRLQLGHRAREHAERFFTASAMAGAFDTLYGEVLS